MKSTIWFQDPEELINPDKLTSFVPSRDDTLNDQLNACVRFSVYLAVTLFFLYFAQGKVKVIVFYIPLFMMIFTYFLYRFHPNVEKFHVPLENQPLRVIEKKHIVPKKRIFGYITTLDYFEKYFLKWKKVKQEMIIK